MPSPRSSKFPLIAAGSIILLGVSAYSMQTVKPPQRAPAQEKRELGLQGAGVGGNRQVGEPEAKPSPSRTPVRILPAGDGRGDNFEDQAIGFEDAASRLSDSSDRMRPGSR